MRFLRRLCNRTEDESEIDILSAQTTSEYVCQTDGLENNLMNISVQRVFLIGPVVDTVAVPASNNKVEALEFPKLLSTRYPFS